MGRSRGGLTSKIHALVDTHGLPMRLALTAGEAHDNRLADNMLSRLKSGSMLLADRGYDADWIRGLEVVADDLDQFQAWQRHALEPAPAPQNPQARADMDTFVRKCGACHTVAGTRAGGILGPDLSHLMTRRMIAAATLPNTILAFRKGTLSFPASVICGKRRAEDVGDCTIV
jgi:hypothetical protein